MKNPWKAAMNYTPSDSFILNVHLILRFLNDFFKLAIILTVFYYVLSIGADVIHHYHLFGSLWGE